MTSTQYIERSSSPLGGCCWAAATPVAADRADNSSAPHGRRTGQSGTAVAPYFPIRWFTGQLPGQIFPCVSRRRARSAEVCVAHGQASGAAPESGGLPRRPLSSNGSSYSAINTDILSRDVGGCIGCEESDR